MPKTKQPKTVAIRKNAEGGAGAGSAESVLDMEKLIEKSVADILSQAPEDGKADVGKTSDAVMGKVTDALDDVEKSLPKEAGDDDAVKKHFNALKSSLLEALPAQVKKVFDTLTAEKDLQKAIDDRLGLVLGKLVKTDGEQVAPAIGFPAILKNREGTERFSICRLVKSQLSGKESDAPFETEVCKVHSSSVTSEGGFLVPTERVPRIIERLTNLAVMRKAGVNVMPVSAGLMELPKSTGAPSATWGTENRTQTPAFGTGGVVRLVPKQLAVLTTVPEQFLDQSSPAADRWLEDEISTELALAEDLAYLQGNGSGSVPKGITNMAGATSVVTRALAAFVATDLDDLVTAVLNENSEVDWIMTTPQLMNVINKFQDANGRFLLDRGATGKSNTSINNIPTLITKQLELSGTTTTQYVLAGNFRKEAIIAQQLGLRITSDRGGKYFQDNLVAIRGDMRVDFNVKHEEAFAYITVTGVS